ncbi:chymotrypsinogen A-like [Penaeus chinensis]|uniref:chymotrypsinogen A-like n=1 Tax=Penaeus chinensis TaxID=139456 RepID=UPI001FB7FFEA|nr:chymotrypsinogen A-like [Penaeus chinensis]
MFLQGMEAVLVAAVLAYASASPALRQSSCGGEVTLQNGESIYFTSPNFPFPYPNDVSCLYLAQSPPGTAITMTCPSFSVAPARDCTLDVFYVSPTGDRFMSNARYFCGSGVVDVTTEGNAFAAYFFSRPKFSYNFYQGFRCLLTVVPKDQGQTTTLAPPTTTARGPQPTTTLPATSPPSDCECGRRSGSRIVGGEEATPNEWPWQAALRFLSNGEVFCGATLVQDSWLVTASHCVEQFDKKDIFVSLGDHVYNQNADTQYEQHITIQEVIMHESYDPLTVDNDIALLRLSDPVQYSPGVGPACLPFQFASKDFQGENATVTGWGTDVFQGNVNEALHEVELPIISEATCKDFLPGAITSNMMCTYDPGRDACQGDSGGPLVWAWQERYYLVGVVSWGRSCAEVGLPGVYARVTNYLEWIEAKTGGGLCYP